MQPSFKNIEEKKLIGKKLTMSYSEYRIGELWSSFMPRRKEIKNNVTNDLISMATYPPTHFTNFSPENKFERWACVEVKDFVAIPADMESFILPSGLYAVFHYTGSSLEIASFFQNIYTVWLPESQYELDNRPHFEILGERYKNNNPLSEEDIWIPVKVKNK
jgi:AraC family transcriptional regulator